MYEYQKGERVFSIKHRKIGHIVWRFPALGNLYYIKPITGSHFWAKEKYLTSGSMKPNGPDTDRSILSFLELMWVVPYELEAEYNIWVSIEDPRDIWSDNERLIHDFHPHIHIFSSEYNQLNWVGEISLSLLDNSYYIHDDSDMTFEGDIRNGTMEFYKFLKLLNEEVLYGYPWIPKKNGGTRVWDRIREVYYHYTGIELPTDPPYDPNTITAA